MKIKYIQEILPLVEKPSQYLGTEINTRKKDVGVNGLTFALAFPDLYEIGTSHFGMQILYNILNNQAMVSVERVFAPNQDMEKYLRDYKLPLVSMESKKPLHQFNIIGFSLLYELNYTNMLTIMDLGGIPFYSSDRGCSDPIIIAGGPCTCNPEPIADFFDAIVIGDGEKVVVEMGDKWLQWDKKNKSDLLDAWSTLEGVYIPSFFKPVYDKNGFQHLTPQKKGYTRVKRTIVPSLEDSDFPDKPIIPFGKPVHDRLRLEIARGCTRGCRFCQAGIIYRPVRERSEKKLLNLAEKTLSSTGYEDISLLSLSTGDFGCLTTLTQSLMKKYNEKNVAISLPSLRAGTITPELMKLIKSVRKTGFTIAPEAGSQRMRNIINKNISKEDIFKTIEDAFALGWTTIKLYFMIGLPMETEQDILGIESLVKEIKKIVKKKGRRKKINLSVNTFIPKSHVSFQWASQISIEESKKKIDSLRKRLREPWLNLKWHNPETSMIEGLFARGDRKLGKLLFTAYKNGCRFDGWADRFDYENWKKSIYESGIEPGFYTTRSRKISEPLPWDHIESGVTKEFLIKEWEKSTREETTQDCRKGQCNECGACDFHEIYPRVFSESDSEITPAAGNFERAGTIDTPIKYKISYSKTNTAKYFGHLEMVSIFIRALRRIGMPLKYSSGFHPMPRVSFKNPLPVGLESLGECFYMTLTKKIRPEIIISDLNKQLPDGLSILECTLSSGKTTHLSEGREIYRITIDGNCFDKIKVEEFLNGKEFYVKRKNKKGVLKKIDLKDIVVKIDLIKENCIEMILQYKEGRKVRPPEVMEHLLGIPVDKIKMARIIKIS